MYRSLKMQCINKVLIYFISVYIICIESKHRLKNKDFGPNIVGGVPVPLEWFPYMVQFFNDGTLCAGVILNSWSVLTSAHCLDFDDNIDDMTIHVGARYLSDSNAQRHKIRSFVTHENYTLNNPFENDIAIIFLKKHIRFGKQIKKGVLVNHDRWMNADAHHFMVAGWGLRNFNGERSNISLMSTYMTYVPSEECKRLHALELSDDMFCLYGDGWRDTCQGDSGGGVLWQGTIVGLTSFGYECAAKDKPTVFTNLWYMRNWIRDKVYDFIKDFCEADHDDRLAKKLTRPKLPKPFKFSPRVPSLLPKEE